MTLKELFTGIANAIRNKKGTTDIIKPTEFADQIDSITLATGNATASQVLSGYTFSNEAENGLTGTMENILYKDIDSSEIGQSSDYFYMHHLPAGYYNSQGTAWGPEVRTPMTNFGNATQGQVLSGASFTSSNGFKISGTMTNQNNWSTTISPGGSITIPAGYHNGSGKVSASSGLYGSPLMKTATNGNQQASSRTATVSFSGKVVTVSGFGYSNNGGPTCTIQILVNGTWVTCSSSNGTITTTTTGSDRNLIAVVWANSGTYRNSTISGARVIQTNGYSDGWGGAHVIAAVV